MQRSLARASWGSILQRVGRWLVVVGVVIAAIYLLFESGNVPTEPPATAARSEGRQSAKDSTKFWRDDQLLKEVIVAYLEYEQKAKKSGVPVDHELGHAVVNLVLLFDSLSSPESVDTFASLSSFYLGAA